MDVTHNNLNHDGVSNSAAKTAVNALAFLAVLAGTIFKMMHWPGADMLILASTVLLLGSVFFMYKDMAAYGNDSTVTMLMSLFMAILLIGTMFRRFHWEGARIVGFASLALAIILSLWLIL